MNKIFWSILSLIPIFLYLLTGTANGQSLRTYEDSLDGLKFQYPSEWSPQVYNSALDGTAVVLRPPNGLGFQVNIETYPTNQTLKEAASRILSSSWEEGAVIDKIVLSGIAGYKSIGSTQHGKKLTTLALRTTPQGIGKIYSITFVGTSTDFNLYLEDVDKMIESFAINPTDQQILDQYQKQQNGMKVRNLQILHNHLVEEDQKQIADCNSRIDSIKVLQKNKSFLENRSEDDGGVTKYQLDKEQHWYDERCSNWKEQTNLTKFDIEEPLHVIP